LTILAPKSPKGDLLPLFATNNAVAVPFRGGRAKIVKEPYFFLIITDCSYV